MKPYFPTTPHPNSDRRYFVDGFTFVKEDDDVKRGLQEARNLQIFRGTWFAPEFRKSEEEGGKHRLHMTRIPGDTLEACRNSLTSGERALVAFQLLKIVAWMLDNGVTHGDLNESNVLIDRLRGQVFLIDFEMSARYPDANVTDIYGSAHGPDQWGLIHLLEYIKATP